MEARLPGGVWLFPAKAFGALELGRAGQTPSPRPGARKRGLHPFGIRAAILVPAGPCRDQEDVPSSNLDEAVVINRPVRQIRSPGGGGAVPSYKSTSGRLSQPQQPAYGFTPIGPKSTRGGVTLDVAGLPSMCCVRKRPFGKTQGGQGGARRLSWRLWVLSPNLGRRRRWAHVEDFNWRRDRKDIGLCREESQQDLLEALGRPRAKRSFSRA